MSTRFSKVHGLGNDFVLIDLRRGGVPLGPERAAALCDRHLGVGADGVLTLVASRVAAARLHITNADGSVPETCGNGIRCAVKHLVDSGSVPDGRVLLETGAGIVACEARRGPAGEVEEVEIDMGAPELACDRIPVASRSARFVREEIDLDREKVSGTAVSMGNPHVVLFDVDPARAGELGPLIERHPLFPQRTNVELARVEGEGLSVAVWERGAGLTRACGSGACAAAVAAVVEGRQAAGPERPVQLPGGVLFVRVAPGLGRVTLRGPAVRVFEGEVDL